MNSTIEQARPSLKNILTIIRDRVFVYLVLSQSYTHINALQCLLSVMIFVNLEKRNIALQLSIYGSQKLVTNAT